jgi:hypothetical protein
MVIGRPPSRFEISAQGHIAEVSVWVVPVHRLEKKTIYGLTPVNSQAASGRPTNDQKAGQLAIRFIYSMLWN